MSTPPVTAVLTIKSDGSLFVGTVVRREEHSITVANSTGDIHTFLYSELSNITYPNGANPGGTSGVSKPTTAAPPPPSASSASSSPAQTLAPPSGAVEFPTGSVFPVRLFGFADSCCAPAGYMLMGTIDSNVTSAGKVVIPEGAHVAMAVRQQYVTDQRVHLQIELQSADFGGHHFVVASSKGPTEEGAVVMFPGAAMGTPEAKSHGLNVHLEDGTLMSFQAASPTILKLSD